MTIKALFRWMLGIWLTISTTTAQQAQQSQFLGSVPAGTLSPVPLSLTLHDAIDRALKANLGLLASESADETARGRRLQSLSVLLPQLNAQVEQAEEQLNLRTLGFNIKIPGVAIPVIVGPFHYTDVRGYAQWSAFDYSSWKNYRSAQQSQRASRLSVNDARDLVSEAAANGCFQIIADAARVTAIQAQVETAQALYDRAEDQQRAGTAAGIDVLRAQVELKQQQQRLLAQSNQLEKDKLALGRVIGLPPGQDFRMVQAVPFSPLTSLNLEQAIQTALGQRSDYQSSKATVRAAEEALRAAHAERYPTAQINADYGDVGTTLASSHGTFTVTAAARITVFDGRRISADEIQAKATLQQRQDEFADLAAQIDVQVRTAFLDLRTAAEQVAVAGDNLDLANQTLVQARDRFAAGVTDNIEVVQAQESVASANDTLISALYAHNLAKTELARALGGAERGIQKFMEGN